MASKKDDQKKQARLMAGMSVTSLTLSSSVLAIGKRAASGTLGQQLTDLKRAHEVGALTGEEYEAQKQHLLEKSSAIHFDTEATE